MKFGKVQQLIDKIKTNVNYAGVILKVHAPSVVKVSDSRILMSVTLTATQTDQTIEAVRVELRGLPIKRPGATNSKLISSYKLLGKSEYTGEFVLSPGVSKTLTFTLPNNIQEILQKNHDYSTTGSKLVRAFKEFIHSFEIIDPKLFDYVIISTATIKNLTLKPEATARVKLLLAEN